MVNGVVWIPETCCCNCQRPLTKFVGLVPHKLNNKELIDDLLENYFGEGLPDSDASIQFVVDNSCNACDEITTLKITVTKSHLNKLRFEITHARTVS